MIGIDIHLFARLSLLGFCAGVGGLYGLTLAFLISECSSRFVFEDHATRRDKARIWALYLRDEFNPDLCETAKYTLGWGAAGAFLFALVTLLIAGIDAVFL